jgi:hypothetical protein
MDPRPYVFEVQNELLLQEWIGYGEMYLMPSSEIERPIHIRVLVDIERAQDLVVIPAATPPLVASFLTLSVNGMLDK